MYHAKRLPMESLLLILYLLGNNDVQVSAM